MSIFLAFYLTMTIAVMVGAVWLDTQENPYASFWDWHGWVLGAFLGATWPTLVVYWIVSLVTTRKG